MKSICRVLALILMITPWSAVLRGAEISAAESGVGNETPVPVGAARIDITPPWPVRLAGYAKRQGSEWRVVKPLHARALAIGGDAAPGPVVLVTVELVGITAALSDGLAEELAASHGIDRARLAVCAIHTHTGPAIDGLLPRGLKNVTAEERAAIVRYTKWLRGRLLEVATAALADRRPGRLAWGQGSAGFAANRRKIVDGKWAGFGFAPDAPVDHALPVLIATDEQGGLRAVFTSYACHCTTDGGGNFIHPDWAGEASAKIERDHPGAVALVGLGCAGDARPDPGGSIEAAARHGEEVAAEIGRLMRSRLQGLGPVTKANYRIVKLSLDQNPPVKAAVTESTLGQKTEVPLPVEVWNFGGDLAMIFLGGEMTADYSLRLRRELDAGRIWVNGYSNNVPCYVASRRMYSEGGYEVDTSMTKYGWPGRLAIGTEDRIIAAVREQVPASYSASGN